MITADKLTLLTNMPAVMLTTAIQAAGYKEDKFQTAKFLGLSNGKQFVYNVTYIEDNEIHSTKVFVDYDPTVDRVSVDY